MTAAAPGDFERGVVANAHELANRVNGIAIHSQLLRRRLRAQDAPESTRRLVDTVLAEVSILTELVRSIERDAGGEDCPLAADSSSSCSAREPDGG